MQSPCSTCPLDSHAFQGRLAFKRPLDFTSLDHSCLLDKIIVARCNDVEEVHRQLDRTDKDRICPAGWRIVSLIHLVDFGVLNIHFSGDKIIIIPFRIDDSHFNERHGLLLSASPSMVGGNRGLWALRQPLEHLGARIFPDMFSLAQAHKALDAEGGIVDPQLGKRLGLTIKAFMDLVEAAQHYPCVMKAWFEFLGEQPDPVIERVE